MLLLLLWLLFVSSGLSIVDACACVCWGGSLMPASEGEGVCDVEKSSTPFVIADLPSAIKHPLNGALYYLFSRLWATVGVNLPLCCPL